MHNPSHTLDYLLQIHFRMSHAAFHGSSSKSKSLVTFPHHSDELSVINSSILHTPHRKKERKPTSTNRFKYLGFI